MQIIATSRSRLELLESLPKQAVCAELGVFRGDFSEQILTRCNPRVLYLVDLFDGVVHSGDRNGENIFAVDMREQFDKLKARFRNYPQVKVIKACSWEWLRDLPPATLDWVYIDTNHNYETTTKELEASWDCTRPHGFITGHDYSESFPGVIQAVNLFAHTRKIAIELWTGDKLPSYKMLCDTRLGRD